jgi:pimeloyl-ACP methyl ester carboxylesterase
MREEAILFGKSKSLVGILTDPPEIMIANKLPVVILLNAGLVYRIGLNRLHVKIARQLAALGFVVFRFDFSGMGDSGVRNDHLPFDKSAVSETQEAMDYLHAARGINQFVLMGICSGAAISYRTALCDSRVVGAVLINARGHLHDDHEELGSYLRNRTLLRHYWRILLDSSFKSKNWVKAITGKIVDYRSILTMMFGFPLKRLLRRNHKGSPVINKAVTDLCLLTDRGVRLFIVHSEGDEGLDYLYVILGDELQALIASGKLKFELIKGANHTFTLLWSQEHLLNSIHNWAREIIERPPVTLDDKV